MQHLGDLTSPARPRILNWINNSGYDCPAFGVFRVGDITESMDDGDDLIISGILPLGVTTGYSSQLYAVNSMQAVPAGGRGRCTLDFPTYAAFDATDGVAAAGQVWGVSNVGFKLKKGYGGFHILGNPVNGVVAVHSQSTPIIKLACKETLKPGIFADAYVMLWNSDDEIWETSTDAAVSVYGGSGWKGVIFGMDTTGLDGEDNISLIDAWCSPHSGNWYPLGKGWSAFQGTATTDGLHGTTINVTPQDYSFSVPAVVKYGDVLTGDKFPVVWSDDENEWQIQPSGTGEVGCGLIRTDGVISLDYAAIVDDGLEVIPGTGEACDTIGVKAGCNVIVDADGVSVDTDSLAGDGLTVTEDTCKKLEVKPDCHITVTADGVGVDTESIAGTGLKASADTCKKLEIDLTAGCGIEITDAEIAIKNSDLEGVGVVAGDGCTLNIALDRQCHVTGTGNEVGIDLDGMVAGGVIEVVPGEGEACDTLDVKTTCGLTKAGGELGVDFEALVGTAEDKGLEVLEGGGVGDCDIIGVKLAPGLKFDETGKIAPDTGCNTEINEDDQIDVNVPALAGPEGAASGLTYATVEESTCKYLVVYVDDVTVTIDPATNKVKIKLKSTPSEYPYVADVDFTDPCNPTITRKIMENYLPDGCIIISDP